MSRAKRKRINAMRRKQRRQADRVFDQVKDPLLALLSGHLYDSAQALVHGRPMPSVIDYLFRK